MSDENESTPPSESVTMVCIDTPPLTITCQEPGAKLSDVVAQALALYRDVYTPDMSKSAGPAMGFVTERDIDGPA